MKVLHLPDEDLHDDRAPLCVLCAVLSGTNILACVPNKYIYTL